MSVVLTDDQLTIQHLRLEVARLEHAMCDAKLLTALLKVPAMTDRPVDLSPRDYDVLVRLIEGDMNQQIGERLFITAATVRTHVERLRKTFHAHTRTGVVIAALRAGAVPLTPEEPTHA